MDFKRRLLELRPQSPRLAGGERGAVLGELRGKMAEILARSGVEVGERPKLDLEHSSLPFSTEETDLGPLCRRHVVLLPSHHVGRMPLDAAHGASAELLALLALDPALSLCRFEKALYLDTETSGLGGAGVIAFLVGLAWFDEAQHLNVEQLLLKSPADEPALLRWLEQRFRDAEVIVSFNGKAFDIPLLRSRAVMNHAPKLLNLPHLDLLHVARRLHRDRLGACRLVMLESDVLGFERGPDIDGAEIPARYAHFLRTGDEEALRQVIEHNAWDVMSMAALVGLYGEPFELLHPEDLVGMARTLKRGRAFEVAHDVAERAVSRGVGAEAYRMRAEIAKARGDRDAALADFERLIDELDDPRARLELAKLYEHHVKAPERALELVLLGTGEDEAALSRRRSRLERKTGKA